jgi:hypothetical protein
MSKFLTELHFDLSPSFKEDFPFRKKDVESSLYELIYKHYFSEYGGPVTAELLTKKYIKKLIEMINV